MKSATPTIPQPMKPLLPGGLKSKSDASPRDHWFYFVSIRKTVDDGYLGECFLCDSPIREGATTPYLMEDRGETIGAICPGCLVHSRAWWCNRLRFIADGYRKRIAAPSSLETDSRKQFELVEDAETASGVIRPVLTMLISGIGIDETGLAEYLSERGLEMPGVGGAA